ncbi:MAG: vanadium-dependent haloperoxidase, partial [Planctomycetia bacterium]|nr:vanadium-dependent haloperoxidase [Planctomycetia bacterium]
LMAIVQTAVYEAVNTVSRRYTSTRANLDPAPDASVAAAVAAANRATLTRLVLSQEAAIDRAYDSAMEGVPEGPSKSRGIAVGKEAASAILALRADDGAEAAESYRPRTSPGVYVPTALPMVPQWPRRKPWLMASPDQFRPGPPPALRGEPWARDYNEVKAIGARGSTCRSAEQADIARFWEGSGPVMYQPIARMVASQPGREVTRNARLLAVAAQAMDDAAIAVFDAKYHYEFWRPITAIRNGDIDGNDATERDASWVPFLETPMHPEYPAAHCVAAATLGAVLQADLGAEPTPRLTATSPTSPGAVRSWTRPEDFVREVADARVWGGIHFRTSTEIGSAMGKKIGELAEKEFRRAP